MRKFRIITFSRYIFKSTTYCRLSDKEYYRVWDMDLWPKHEENKTNLTIIYIHLISIYLFKNTKN